MISHGQTGSNAVEPVALRTISAIPKTGDVKSLCYDQERAALRPNLVFVEPDGSIVFEINEVGLKGDPLDPSRKLVVVWDDSVVFSGGRGWPCLLDHFARGYQFLNGGIDGDPYANILRRASVLNRDYEISLNLLMLGWHPFVPRRPTQSSSGLRDGFMRRRKRQVDALRSCPW